MKPAILLSFVIVIFVTLFAYPAIAAPSVPATADKAALKIRGEYAAATTSGKVTRLASIAAKTKDTVRFSSSLTAVNKNTLTVGTYTVIVSDSTKILRRFGGKSDLLEFNVGDNLQVLGKTGSNENTVDAKLIRNLSLQKRRGAFVGIVKSIKPETGEFVLETLNRGDQAVSVDSKTLYRNRQEKNINFSDLKVGHKIRVKGLWDNKLNTVTEVRNIKDYSLPLKSAQTATPSAATQ